jgi:uncharacterized protein (DUF983 family)
MALHKPVGANPAASSAEVVSEATGFRLRACPHCHTGDLVRRFRGEPWTCLQCGYETDDGLSLPVVVKRRVPRLGRVRIRALRA